MRAFMSKLDHLRPELVQTVDYRYAETCLHQMAGNSHVTGSRNSQ